MTNVDWSLLIQHAQIIGDECWRWLCSHEAANLGGVITALGVIASPSIAMALWRRQKTLDKRAESAEVALDCLERFRDNAERWLRYSTFVYDRNSYCSDVPSTQPKCEVESERLAHARKDEYELRNYAGDPFLALQKDLRNSTVKASRLGIVELDTMLIELASQVRKWPMSLQRRCSNNPKLAQQGDEELVNAEQSVGQSCYKISAILKEYLI
jgi:hypothetical protein